MSHLAFRSFNIVKAEYGRIRDEVPAASELVDLIVVCEQEAPLTLLRHEVVAANGREIAQVDILPGHNMAPLIKRAWEHWA